MASVNVVGMLLLLCITGQRRLIKEKTVVCTIVASA
jgi:hypothetical protein